MGGCEFCSDYEWQKNYEKLKNREHNEDPNRTFNLRTTFGVSIVARTWRYGGNGNYINRAGTYSHGSYQINYCPVCGKKVK